MAFNLPAAQYLFRTNASNANAGTFDTVPALGSKNGGNLPITASAAQLTNSSGNRGVYFGLVEQDDATSFDASVNTKVMLTSVQFNAPNRIQVGTKAQRGIVVRLVSGLYTAYREFVVGGNDTPFASAQAGPVTMCLDLSSTSHDSSSGTYDNSNVTRWGYGTFRVSLVGGSSNLNFFQRLFLFDTQKGGANLPTFTGASSFDDAVLAVQGSGYATKLGAWLTQSGSSFFVPCPFSFGDGSTAINFDDNGVSVVSPADNSVNQENFRLTNDSMRIYLNMRTNAADSVILSGSYAWGTAADWNFNQSRASSCLLSGNFTGMGNFRIGSSVTATGSFSLATGKRVQCRGANIDSITVTGDLDIETSSVTSFSNISVGGVMDFDTAGTYTLTNCSVNEVSNSSGGAVTLINVGSTITTNTGPSITIVSVTTLTLTGLQANSEVRVYEAGTTTEVAGIENSSTTFSSTLSTSLVDIVVHSVDYEYLRLNNVDTSANLTLPIQQRFDRSFRNA